MADQQYAPYRSMLLSRDELIEFNDLRVRLVIRDIAVLWVQILALWGLAAVFGGWWLLAISAALVGNRYYSLYIIGHDGLHRRLHSKVSTNDFINDFFVLGPLGAITRINRSNHMRHHADFATDSDPDRYKYFSRHWLTPVKYLFSLTGVPFVLKAFGNVYAGDRSSLGGQKAIYRVRDIVIIVAWQFALFSALGYTFGWWGYFLMWLLPVYVFTYAADILRVYCEHSNELNDECYFGERLVTYLPGQIELALFAPMNMNHHVAHHLWPSIPYYNLPKVTKLIYSRQGRLPYGVALLRQRESYVRYTLDRLNQCFREKRTAL